MLVGSGKYFGDEVYPLITNLRPAARHDPVAGQGEPIMALTINTNVASLNAQRNLSRSQDSLATSLQRLSSGLRINSAKDDAAGLAISERFTTQIRGLSQAVRNANDGISLSQVAEGALSETSNALQRIRELAIQAANSTNSISDRAALNSEAQQLLSEIQRVATQTTFNGQKILDGSFSTAQFQVGADANQTISVSITGATTNLLGSYQTTGMAAVSSDVFDGSNFTINGVNVGSSAATSAPGVTAASAAAKATAINAVTSQTGVTATATNTVTGVAPVPGQALQNGDLVINGIAIGSIAKDADAAVQAQNAVTAINAVSNQTGVTATRDAATGAITLTAADGRDIRIEAGNAGSAAIVTDIYNATGLDAATEADPTGNDTALLTIDANAVVTTDTNGSGSADIVLGDTISIDGVTYEFNTAGTTTSNVLVVVAATNDEVAVGNALANAITAQYNAGNTTVSVVNNGDGTLNLTNNLVGAAGISYAETLAADSGAAIGIGAVAGGTDAAGNTAVDNRGTLTLSSAENFLLGGTSTGLAAAGASSASTALTQLATVDISTVDGANAALSVLDGALSQVSTIRADLGAIQNRLGSTIANLSNLTENLSAARSRVQDADFAAETANLTRNQILQQAGVAILAQANGLPQLALSLLQ